MTGVILAAGAGRRMGNPKLLLPVNGRPMLSWVVDLVERLPLEERVIVLGAEADAVRATLWPSPTVPLPPGGGGEGEEGATWRIVVNQGWVEGMGSSLRCAAKTVADGMLVFLGDMPWVPEEAARAVIARVGDRPVAPAYQGQRGFPVYLPPSLRPALVGLRGDVGARGILAGCELIPWDDAGVIRDVDRREDLAHA